MILDNDQKIVESIDNAPITEEALIRLGWERIIDEDYEAFFSTFSPRHTSYKTVPNIRIDYVNYGKRFDRWCMYKINNINSQGCLKNINIHNIKDVIRYSRYSADEEFWKVHETKS